MRPRGFPTGEPPQPKEYAPDPEAEARRRHAEVDAELRREKYARAMEHWAGELIRPLSDEQRKALLRVLDRVLNSD